MSAASATAERLPPAAVSTAPGEVAIRLAAVSKRFVARRSMRDILRRPFDWKYQQALRDVSCEIRRGEFFGLLGPNGAGKTTLFKILATFVTPDTGSATIEGCDLRTQADAARALVTPAVADERSLKWRLSARENLRLYASLYGLPAREISARVGELLEAVGLEHTGIKLVGEFSTGMKQRLLIARALLPRPRILLLDEPTRGLDPVLARNFRSFLREEIGTKQGCTVLLATHNTEEAFELCDRVGILDRGRLLDVGPANRLREKYGHERYRVWTRTPHHRAFDELERRGVVRTAPAEPGGQEGWMVLELDLPGGAERAAMVLELLVREGVAPGRFERVSASLADLIERVVHGSAETDRA